jgi:predicted phage-related endonuclease
MIDSSRFLVPSSDYQRWLQVRASGVTATAVSKAVTPAGFREQVGQMKNPRSIPDNDYMRFGREQEESLIEKLATQFDLQGNDWLIAKNDGDAKWQMATPDGLSSTHEMIAEVKTTGKDWGEWRFVPGHYQRQVQWQLHVTGATSCVFGWMLRENKGGNMVPGWRGPKFVVVERDEALIERLVEVAHDLYRELPLASS